MDEAADAPVIEEKAAATASEFWALLSPERPLFQSAV
jgi:hypothetical protein